MAYNTAVPNIDITVVLKPTRAHMGYIKNTIKQAKKKYIEPYYCSNTDIIFFEYSVTSEYHVHAVFWLVEQSKTVLHYCSRAIKILFLHHSQL